MLVLQVQTQMFLPSLAVPLQRDTHRGSVPGGSEVLNLLCFGGSGCSSKERREARPAYSTGNPYKQKIIIKLFLSSLPFTRLG